MSLFISVAGLILSVAALATSTLLLFRQMTFMRHANQIPVSLNVMQEYRSADFQDARDYVLTALPAEHDPSLGFTHLPQEARRPAIQVTSLFSSLGSLVFFDMIDEKFVVSTLGYRVNEAWEVLEPYILNERKIRNDKDFQTFFEDLVCRIRENWPPEDAYGLKLKSARRTAPSTGIRRAGRS